MSVIVKVIALLVLAIAILVFLVLDGMRESFKTWSELKRNLSSAQEGIQRRRRR